ncbi:MAG: YdeI/OmpD-associated family protein [Paracoccaceae bacterium]|nr:YdeI/OmpD-associated family protein [Paracoccaceae bacterium]
MTATEKFAKIEVESAAALEDWLAAHHGQAESVWLVTYLASVPEKYLSREAVLDALVAWGWIDGIRRRLDDTRTMQLISPRKTEHWAKSYKDRAARLEADGRMQDPGRAAIARGKASGLWSFMDDVDALIVPSDLAGALAAAGAEGHFEAFAPSYRRNVLRWIKLAKSEATRSKRVAKAAETAARRKKMANF